METLISLNKSLEQVGSRLLVVRGEPMQVFKSLHQSTDLHSIHFEVDTEQYARERDYSIKQWAETEKIGCYSRTGHTLFDVDRLLSLEKCKNNQPPLRYQSFLDLIENEIVDEPLDAPTTMPSIDQQLLSSLKMDSMSGPSRNFSVLTLNEVNEQDTEDNESLHPGGEHEALRRMEEFLKDTQKVTTFAKPETDPSLFKKPYSTTVLSMYLKFGSLSVRLLYSRLLQIERKNKKHSMPPVSLRGQVLWREFYYLCASGVPGYAHMKDNQLCLQTEWRCRDGWHDANDPVAEQHLLKWSKGQTGYPWIDAIMTQLRQEGWIHHLARHCVACFLTRGDLYISWERGVEVFDELLLDADPALNVGNWMWLSASMFFNQYFRVYSPVSFGKKYDTDGEYIKHYLPVLKDMPSKYIYEPWKAPKSVQQKAKCVVGVDYPDRIVDHDEARKQCMQSMKESYQTRRDSKDSKTENTLNNEDNDRNGNPKAVKKRRA